MGTVLEHGSFVDEKAFGALIAEDVRPFLELSFFATQPDKRSQIKTRAFLGELNNVATRLEDLLDAYGAKHNSFWFSFREHVAVAKTFAEAAYSLNLIANKATNLILLPDKSDFTEATNEAWEEVTDIIECNSNAVIRVASKLGFTLPDDSVDKFYHPEQIQPTRLPADRKKRKLKRPEKTIVYLATAFLDIAEESDLLDIHGRVHAYDYPACIPDDISEEKLMVIENKFHSLQSLYDTYLSESNIEDHDKNLIILRSHIAVIYHLLDTATQFSHFYERHIDVFNKGLKLKFVCPVAAKSLLSILMTYSVAFAHAHIMSANNLCRHMVRQYATQDRIRVNIPVYRGFHVRPSTMIAKIIKHYGGKVIMRLSGDEYNASSPLELFRANEKINAKKRKILGEEILKLPLIHKAEKTNTNNDMRYLMKMICMDLMEKKKLIIYEKDFSCEGVEFQDGESMPGYIKRWLANCLAAGKIDIWLDQRVEFVGDQRVLDDIKLLADHGYGEDSHGNNIVLPKQLAYLRR